MGGSFSSSIGQANVVIITTTILLLKSLYKINDSFFHRSVHRIVIIIITTGIYGQDQIASEDKFPYMRRLFIMYIRSKLTKSFEGKKKKLTIIVQFVSIQQRAA